MLNIITCDFETFWNSKDYTLSKMGPIEYIRDQRFAPQLLGVAVNRGPAKIFSGVDEIRYALQKLELDKPDKIVVGHNLNGFDALIMSEYFGVHPALMMDTMVMARWCGVARMQNESHAKLTDWLGNGHKRAGTVISDGKAWPDQFTKAEQEDFKRYCCEDVEQCRDNFYSMLQYFKGKPDQFTELLTFATMTAKMATEPKLVIDRGILESYIDRLDAEAEASRKELSELFHFASTDDMLKAVRSSGKFCEMLRALGMEPPMKPSEKKTATLKAKLEFERETAVMKGEDTTELDEQIADLVDHPVMSPALSKNDLEFTALRDHPDPRIALLVDTRLEHNSSIQRSRAVSLLKFADGVTPVPVMLNALKAHTGRYSAGVSEGKSDGLQFQNLSKRDASKLDLRRAIHVPEGYAFVACDSSQIEARILAYAANETELVEQFRQKRDPYSELAEKIFGVPWQDIKSGAKSGDKKMKMYRNVGKTGILSCFAGDTEVLTDTGWKPIVMVSETDKLWDGESWVRHNGLICNGKKNTIELAGVRVTPDHLIFDGFSWKTVAALQNEPRYLKSAMFLAVEQSLIALWNNESVSGVSCTNVNVANAEHYIGTMDTLFPEENVQPLARIAAYVTEQICGALHENTLTLKSDSDSGISQSSVVNEDCSLAEQTRTVESICHLFNATVVQNLSGHCKQILEQAGLHGVTCVRRNSRTLQDMDQTMSAAQSLFLTPDCESVTSNESMYADNGVKILRTPLTRAMEEEVLSFVSRMLGISYYTYPRLKAGMTLLSSSTVSTTMETTKEETYAWLHGLSNAVTDVLFHLYKQKTTNSEKNCSNSELQMEEVYDIRNAGPNHRFVVRSKVGWLWCHNCGYGVGHTKYSNTLLRQGIRLHEDLDRHHELARYAHGIYRLAHPNIVAFWMQCQQVIEHMFSLKDTADMFSFGGPDGKLFKYGWVWMPSASGDLRVPSILLPNGYAIRYPGLDWQRNEKGKTEWTYEKPLGKNIVKSRIYGSQVVENICQSLAFFMLAWQGANMYRAGIPIVDNIHDSFGAVVPAADADATLAKMEHHMSCVPTWLPGFPVACEGEIGTDFTIA